VEFGHSAGLLGWDQPPPDQLGGCRRASRGLLLSKLTGQPVLGSLCLPETTGFRMVESSSGGVGEGGRGVSTRALPQKHCLLNFVICQSQIMLTLMVLLGTALYTLSSLIHGMFPCHSVSGGVLQSSVVAIGHQKEWVGGVLYLGIFLQIAYAKVGSHT